MSHRVQGVYAPPTPEVLQSGDGHSPPNPSWPATPPESRAKPSAPSRHLHCSAPHPHLSTPPLSPLPWVPSQPVTMSLCSVGCACPHEPAGHRDVPWVCAEVPSWGQYLEISVTRQSQELQPLGKNQQLVTACDSSATPTLPGWGCPGSLQGQEPLQEPPFLPAHLPGFGVLSRGQQQGEDSKRG